MVTKEKGKYLIPVVLSTFNVLGELSRSGPLSLAELSQRTKAAKSTVFRILNTLHHLGYVRRDAQNRSYSLSSRLSELSRDLDWGPALQRIARPHMLRLRNKFTETVNLGRLDLDRVIYLEVIESEHTLRLCERKGGWEHAHASALGKVMLAFSPPGVLESFLESGRLPSLTSKTISNPEEFGLEMMRIRRRGFAFDREEVRQLAVCVAAPILDAEGFAIAGLSISGPIPRFNPLRDKTVAQVLVETAQLISESMAGNRRSRDFPVPAYTS